MTNVKLVDVKGAYDVIISLGNWCGPSVNLRERQLRRFSFPLDDFPVLPHQDWTQTYASYKEKMNVRIRRFYEVLNNSRAVLFIRWGEVNPPEAALLHAVLSSFVPGTCNILVLQTMHDIQDVRELDWGIDGICTLQVPIDRPNDEFIWNQAMEGLSLTGYWKG
ncbi:hypothetical protein [Paenibacillus lautus]|uniref:hypothetical protein n=1 Tax=Paenibacillus lautus TaxID=1401 RepID=UPI003D2DD87C